MYIIRNIFISLYMKKEKRTKKKKKNSRIHDVYDIKDKYNYHASLEHNNIRDKIQYCKMFIKYIYLMFNILFNICSSLYDQGLTNDVVFKNIISTKVVVQDNFMNEKISVIINEIIIFFEQIVILYNYLKYVINCVGVEKNNVKFRGPYEKIEREKKKKKKKKNYDKNKMVLDYDDGQTTNLTNVFYIFCIITYYIFCIIT
ncbi:hypothetical protein PFFCH_01024 [Plasmodium falciparum FCH/4]|uniref:Uncharacterized protein n=1 Tax=Plasmodium falciparum FCH/4 TaxID=1036724 RepID=A0A024VTJ9_PLAFA|nr:hypothetical protein PFFCH_01024 [Plasmodium falciparum FCH/4]